jgi:hypothetical protein
VFSGQPFNCAIAGNAGDSVEWHAKMLANGGAASSTNDHCKSNVRAPCSGCSCVSPPPPPPPLDAATHQLIPYQHLPPPPLPSRVVPTFHWLLTLLLSPNPH